MGSFISRQPNGLLCRFSTVVDTITDYNMTEDEYIEMCAEKARRDAREVLKKHIKPFDWVKEHFSPMNETQEEFDKLVEEMSKPKSKKS
ncbi:hypothetical protein M2138_000173 [Dysgonomonadaceae bacterium PH5-43]|nr:hypothetical protein [Dysgonomonadaceae bacterium PH5-43]